MNIYIFLSFLFMFFSNCLLAKDVLLTQNKVGSHFCLYSLQYLTHRKVMYFGNTEVKVSQNLDFDENLPCILHTHITEELAHLSSEDRVVVQVRDPKEILLRYYGCFYTKKILDILINNLDYDPQETFSYPPGLSCDVAKKITLKRAIAHVNHIKQVYQFYHDMPSNVRLIVRYEDLIKRPGVFFNSILRHYDSDNSRLEDYINNIDHLKIDCKQRYVDQFNHSHLVSVSSDSKSVNYYSLKYDIEDVRLIKKALIVFFGEELSQYIQWAEDF